MKCNRLESSQQLLEKNSNRHLKPQRHKQDLDHYK